MEFIFFILVVFMFLYLKHISGRLANLEKSIREGAPRVSGNLPSGSASGSPMTVATPHPNLTQAEPENQGGLHTDLGTVSTTQWVAGVGAVALLFGVGFFLKYAIDQGWLTEVMRIVLGAVVGTLLVLLGDLWKNKYSQYAQVLSGGGIAILYFTIFASYQFYNQITQPVALVFMIVVTLLGVGLSYRYDSKALGFLAVLGGYISPLLLDAHRDQQINLFTYPTLLNIGVLIMLLKRYWVELLYLALIGTGLDFIVWADRYSNVQNSPESVTFFVLNFVLTGFITALTFRKLHEDKNLPKNIDFTLGSFYTILGISIFSTVTALLYPWYESYLGPVMFLLSVASFLSYAVIDRLNYQKINYPLSFIGSKFLVAGILWQFDGYVATLYLILTAMIGFVVGVGVKRKELRDWAVVVLLFASFKVFFDDVSSTSDIFINTRFALGAITTVCWFFIAWSFDKYFQETEKLTITFSNLAASAMLWLAVSVEIVTKLGSVDTGNARNLVLSLWWMALAVVLAVLGGNRKLHDLRKGATVLFVLTVLKVFLYDVQALDLGYRIVSFILLGTILLFVAFFYQKNKDRLKHFVSGEVEPTKQIQE